MPGVILTEALAQTAGIAAASAHSQVARPRYLLSAIRRMKFFHAVRPEERIVLHANKLAASDELVQFEVAALVSDKEVASGQLVLSVIHETK